MDIKEKGEKLYLSGFNCSEAVARISKEAWMPGLSEDAIKAASVFGGGIANHGEI